MNDCINVKIRDLLPTYLHGKCDDEQEEMVATHIADCADCTAELELLRSVVNSRPIHSYVSPEDIRSVVAAIPTYKAVSRNNWARFRNAAAILIAGIGITTFALSKDVDIWRGSSKTTVVAGSQLDSNGDSFARGRAESALSRGDAAGVALVNVTSLSSAQIEDMMNDLQDFELLPEGDLASSYSFDPMAAEYLEMIGTGDDIGIAEEF